MVVILLLLLGFPQDKVSIRRSAKGPYAKSVPKCRDAERKIDSDPREAIEIIDVILADGRVKKRECRIRWEVRPGDYSRWYDFFPYQFRARARMKLAGSADKNAKLRLLRDAERDLEESIRRGLPKSEEYLTDVQKQIREIEDGNEPVNPEPEFRKAWLRLVNLDSFKLARDHVQKKGTFLDDKGRKKYVEETDQFCRDYLLRASTDFLENVERLADTEALQKLSRSAFTRRFSLPEGEQLTVTLPLYDWCLSVQKTLEQVRKRKESLKALLTHAEEAASLSKEGEILAFVGMENLAFDLVYRGIEEQAGLARNAEEKKRTELRSGADALRKQWDGFQKRVIEAARGKTAFLREIPERNFEGLWSRFPVNASELKGIPSRLQETIDAEDPADALSDIRVDVRKLRDRFDSLSVESRRGVVTFEIVILALRRFLSGDSVSTVVREVGVLGRELKELGGSFKVTSYGPKVGAVFKGLR